MRRTKWLGLVTAVVLAATLLTTGGTANASVGAYYGVSNLAYRTCATALNNNINVVVGQSVCINSDLELWFRATYQGPPGQPSFMHLVNRARGYCLEVNNNSTAPGARIDVFDCNSPGVDWLWEPRVATAFGTYGLLEHFANNLPTGQCLDTVGGSGSLLMQFTCDRTLHNNDPMDDPQLWKFS